VGMVAMLVPAMSLAAPLAMAAKGATASVLDYSQCQNGPAGTVQLACDRWGNGILNSSNSHYAEDQVTPQRLLLSTPSGSTNTVTIRYMTRKGSANVHAYDSLATWNYTQVNADRCQGLKSADCPSGTASIFQMKSDPNAVQPSATGVSNITAAHELPAASRQWTMFGGEILDATVPVHSLDPADPGSDYAKVTVTFRANATKVQLLFGGHLAASTGERGWGAGLGASNINGGPYHIILDALNGASTGSRDNQIMAGAILPGSPAFSVVKTADATVATPGQLVTYTITVTNNGTASGATTFTDDFDDRLNPTTPAGCTREPVTNPPSNKQFTCTTGSIAPNGGTQVFTYTATMPLSFTSGAGTGGCDPGQFPVLNTVTLASGDSDDALVCVTAAPQLTVVKTASPSNATPGQTVTYTITISNTGSASGSTDFTDNFDDRLNPTLPTAAPPGGSCSREAVTNPPSDKLFNCTSGTIAAGGSQTWTYTAVMPSTFTGAPGGNGCSDGSTGPAAYPVRNVVVLANGDDDDAVVCVTASPSFTVNKTFTPSNPVSPGATVTYTITITNGGTAPGSTTFTDNFDDRIDPTTPTPSPAGGSCSLVSPGGDDQFSCTSGIIEPGQSQTWTYTGTMPTTFTGDPGGNGCSGGPTPPATYPVRNVVVLANGSNDDAVVCVTASPTLTVQKTANPSTANPGQLVTYTIVISNTGSAPGSTTFTDNFDDRLNPTTPTASPTGGSCTLVSPGGDKQFSCTSGVIPAGGSQTWTYTATMPTSFTGTPGGNGCNPAGTGQQYPVRNVVVLANGDNDDAVVCVNAAPDLTLVKSVEKTTDTEGHEVLTYTLTYTNTGAAEAPQATITETVPAGTTYDSCTGGCAVNGDTVTWTVGPIAPRTGTGSVTLTVVVTTHSACSITNTATISAPGFNGGNPVNSNTLVTPVTPSPDPDHANASGNAFGALVTTHGLVNVTTTTLSDASSSQSGVGGPSTDSETLLNASVPAILEASALRTTSSSEVTANPPQATSTSTSEVLGLCVLRVATVCTVESSTVRAVARADAFGTGASISAAGSTIENLKVAGVVTPVDLNQTTTIPLAALVFGAGSYVAINERIGGTSLSGGAYRADLEVNMIRVHVTGAVGIQAVDVTVAHAEAHADFPQLTLCGPQVDRSVSGHAFVAHAAVLPPLVLATVGFVGIPASGGNETQNLASASLANGSLLTTGVATSRSLGVIDATSASSGSRAQVAGVCLLRFAAKPSQCVVMADALKAVSTSVANSSGATSSDQVSSSDKTEFVNLVIRTAPDTPLIGVPINPAPNTVITIPGIGFIVLNEQICDNGSLAATTQPRCQGAHHSGLTVRSLHVVLLRNFGAFSPGVEVIVAEAHSDASSN
jgi:uncharacterized repeat protein (TIGR01451 family)